MRMQPIRRGRGLTTMQDKNAFEEHSIDASLSFEQALEQLQALVQKLESGQLPLEESVAAFELGVRLSRHCEALLDAADRRLQMLDDDPMTNENGEQDD